MKMANVLLVHIVSDLMGELLHSYMKFRAEREGVRCTLTPTYFEDAWNKGCRSFFGVKIEAYQGETPTMTDDQNPEAFAAWKALRGIEDERIAASEDRTA